MQLAQEHKEGKLEITYLPTNEMPADGLTEALSQQPLQHFNAMLNLVDLRTIASQGRHINRGA